MNNERRKTLNDLQKEIMEIRYRAETVLEEEQEAFDNMPENMQYSERAEKAENAISNIEYIIQSLDEAIEQINEATE